MTSAHPPIAGAPTTAPPAGRVPVDWRRIRRPLALWALVLSFVSAIGTSAGSVVAGRLADTPTQAGVVVLAICVIGAAIADLIGRTIWAHVIDRAEGQLRADLLDAAMDQPLAELTEQAVGEVLDRIDDDTHEVGQLIRMPVWQALRTVLGSGPLWLVAGLTWWPAFILFPLAGAATFALVRPVLPVISQAKVAEEIAWTDHAAAMEEAIAGRDDLRTSLGAAYTLRRSASLVAEVMRRLVTVLVLEGQVIRRSGVLLHALLALTAVAGAALVVTGRIDTAALVTLFLVTTSFVGQLSQLARHLPDLQAGFGAVLRLRGLLGAQREPTGGMPLPEGPLDVEFRELHFAYEQGRFALDGISLSVAAGATCAFVGRTGSGKSTLASLLSRAVEPDRGSVFVGGRDVLDLDLASLRRAVGVVTQRTEILAGTLAENVALFEDIPRVRIEAAIDQLGLREWVASLPDALDTVLGPGGTTLSAGEQQLVAFARLLVREVSIVVLDEATARMDALTESRVVRAADHLLTGRTGILIAHRLSTITRASQVAVLDHGRLMQAGPRIDLAGTPGPFRDLLAAAGPWDGTSSSDAEIELFRDEDPGTAAVGLTGDPASVTGLVPVHGHQVTGAAPESGGRLARAGAPGIPATATSSWSESIGTVRRSVTPPAPPQLKPLPSLASATWRAGTAEPQWGLGGIGFFIIASVTGAFGAFTGWAWGHAVTSLQAGNRPWGLVALTVISLVISPVALSFAIRIYPMWWVMVMMRVRTSVLAGQIATHRLQRTPPGEVVSRAMDAERLAQYADRWVDVSIGIVIVVVTATMAGSAAAGLVLLVILLVSAAVALVGRPMAGRSAAASSAARARFGRYLVSALESVRTVKLASATPAVHAHLRAVDAGRVDAAIREHRIQAVLDGVPNVLVQCGAVAAWGGLLVGWWNLATAILVAGAVNGFDWFGKVAGSVITEAPGTRSWLHATSAFAGGGELMDLPEGTDLMAGVSADPVAGPSDRLQRLRVERLDAIHDDGTVGVSGVDLDLSPGELVLLVGPVGSGKSSLLSALAGLVTSTGTIAWNGLPVRDPQAVLRPGRVAHVAQVPRVLSGTWRDNVELDHSGRSFDVAARISRLEEDVADAGGPDTLVGHRGLRLSGGQVQRLALARALACEAELLLADDVSSALDAATEVELWQALRDQGLTVLGATSKAAALEQADRVLVLVGGRIAAQGRWQELSSEWGHLAG